MLRRKFLLLGAVLMGIAMAGLAPPARANFALRYSTDGGGTWTTGVVNMPVLFVGGGTIAVTSTSNGPLGSSLDLLVSGVQVANGDLRIQASLDGLLTMPPPETLTYHYTGGNLIVNNGQNPSMTINTFTGETWIDQSNQLFGGATGGPAGAIVIADTLAQSIPAGPTSTGFSGSSPYSITTELHLNLTVSNASDSLSADLNNTISAAPAPAGVVLVASSVPFLGLVWRRRRNKSKPR